MITSLFSPLQTCFSGAMLEAEGGWGKYPKTRYARTKKGAKEGLVLRTMSIGEALRSHNSQRIFLRENDLYNRLALLYYGTLFLGGELVSTA